MLSFRLGLDDPPSFPLLLWLGDGSCGPLEGWPWVLGFLDVLRFLLPFSFLPPFPLPFPSSSYTVWVIKSRSIAAIGDDCAERETAANSGTAEKDGGETLIDAKDQHDRGQAGLRFRHRGPA